jgi:hypothetical protein
MQTRDASPTPRPAAPDATIVLVSGRMKMRDRVGHHDYAAGCALLAAILGQSAGVHGIVVGDGWPEDEALFDSARAVVCYGSGGTKHDFFATPQRVARIQRLTEQGVGLVLVHQAVRCPGERVAMLSGWAGGAHVVEESDRGHWRTHHRDCPAHPVTRGVEPWAIRDGWLRQIRFVDGMHGVTPLLWSSRRHGGSSAGGSADVVAWAYDRPDGGRSFSFTGLDAHSAWAAPGVRRLIVNGILWAAGLPVPDGGAPCAVDDEALRRYLTPRQATSRLDALMRRLRGLARG